MKFYVFNTDGLVFFSIGNVCMTNVFSIHNNYHSAAEGQYGIIGEINLTYVIVNSWDGRRLTLPINYFLEKPFENWTRDSPEIIAKVKFYLDYTIPVEDIREKFVTWVKESPLWDGRACNFMVTGLNDKTMELRGIMSARDSGDAFDLECTMREKIIKYIRENYPDSLPKNRIAQNA